MHVYDFDGNSWRIFVVNKIQKIHGIELGLKTIKCRSSEIIHPAERHQLQTLSVKGNDVIAACFHVSFVLPSVNFYYMVASAFNLVLNRT